MTGTLAGPLIGRDRQLELVVAAVDTDRVVTISGPGGVGKTRLAQAVIDRLGPDRTVELVELDIGESTVSIAEALARRVLGDRYSATDPLSALEGAIGDHPVLVVLDCFDETSHPAQELMEILQRCPRMQLLVTSLGRTRLAGERVIVLEPLEVPSPGADANDISVLENPTVQLLIEVANRSGRPLSSDTDRASLAELARRSAGLPLAVELLSGWLAVYSPAELAAVAGSSAIAFSGGEATRPERHRNLRALLRWATDHLDDEQRRLLQTVATLPCPSDRALLGQLTGTPVDGALRHLVEYNLLVDRRDDRGQRMFDVLDPIRLMLTSEPLVGVSLDAAIAAIVNDVLTQWLAKIGTDETEAAIDAITRVDPLLGPAVGHLATDDRAKAASMASRLVSYWTATARFEAGARLLGSLIPAATYRRRDDARLLAGRAELLTYLGQAQGMVDANRAYERATEEQDHETRCSAALSIAHHHMFVGNWVDARSVLEDQRPVFGSLSPTLSVRIGTALAGACFNNGDYDEASSIVHDLVRIPDPDLPARCDLLAFRILLGEHQQADLLGLAEEGVDLLGRWNRPGRESLRLRYWCVTALLEHDVGRALELSEPFVDDATAVGLAKWLILSRLARAKCLALSDEVAAALRLFHEAADLVVRTDDPMSDLLISVSRVAIPLGLAPDDQRRLIEGHLAMVNLYEGFSSSDPLQDTWLDRVVPPSGMSADELARARTHQLTAGELRTEYCWARDRLGEMCREQVGGGRPAPRPARLSDLSDREYEVLVLAGRGLTDREIAAELVIGIRTVSSHMAHVYRKLSVANRRQAVALL